MSKNISPATVWKGFVFRWKVYGKMLSFPMSWVSALSPIRKKIFSKHSRMYVFVYFVKVETKQNRSHCANKKIHIF